MIDLIIKNRNIKFKYKIKYSKIKKIRINKNFKNIT